MCSEYSGWSNYPTWNVKLWLDNDGLLEMAMDAALENSDSPHRAGDAVKEMLEEVMTVPEAGMEADIWGWAWEQVNWYEIGESLIADLDELDDEDEDDENDEEDTDDDE